MRKGMKPNSRSQSALVVPLKKRSVRDRSDRDTVSLLYDHLKPMVTLYKIRPGERINELDLAKRFQVSRTPLRESLNRLVAENLITFVPNQGFFVRQLETQEAFDLYELRGVIEVAGIRLAVERASDVQIKEFCQAFSELQIHITGATDIELVAHDETFHLRLLDLSGNKEMVRALEGINARIRFVRCIDMVGKRDIAFNEHAEILAALQKRDIDKCTELMASHVGRRVGDVRNIVEAGVIRLYAT